MGVLELLVIVMLVKLLGPQPEAPLPKPETANSNLEGTIAGAAVAACIF